MLSIANLALGLMALGAPADRLCWCVLLALALMSHCSIGNKPAFQDFIQRAFWCHGQSEDGLNRLGISSDLILERS